MAGLGWFLCGVYVLGDTESGKLSWPTNDKTIIKKVKALLNDFRLSQFYSISESFLPFYEFSPWLSVLVRMTHTLHMLIVETNDKCSFARNS